MKRTAKHLLALLGALALTVGLWIPSALAADAASAVSVSASSVNVGSTFTVTVKVSGSSIGSIEGMLTYDANVVEFVSGNGANGNGGTVKVSLWDTTGNGVSALTSTMTFTAKAAGSTSLAFTPSEVTNGNLENISADGASANVSVTSPTPLSANANLASLKISVGTLSPAFSANTTSYSVTVENSVTKLTLSAVPQDKDAKVSVSGSDTLKVGSNTRTITVTAPNGTTKKYTVRITRKAAEGAPPPSQSVSSEEPIPVVEPVQVKVGGQTMTVIEDLTDIEIPAGFSPSEQTLNDNVVFCLRNKAGIPLLYLKGEETSGFYVYDNEKIAFTPYAPFVLGGVAYLPLEKPRNLALPHDFAAAELTIGETVFPAAWQSQTDADFYLLYLCGPDTYVGFYQYDSVEGTLQRYVTAKTEDTASPLPETPALTGVAAFIGEHWLPLTVAVGVILLGLTLALVLVAVKKGGSAKAEPAPQEQEPEEDLFEDLDGIVFDFENPESPEPSAEEQHKEEM